jgi:hypothetical protein
VSPRHIGAAVAMCLDHGWTPRAAAEWLADLHEDDYPLCLDVDEVERLIAEEVAAYRDTEDMHAEAMDLWARERGCRGR